MVLCNVLKYSIFLLPEYLSDIVFTKYLTLFDWVNDIELLFDVIIILNVFFC